MVPSSSVKEKKNLFHRLKPRLVNPLQLLFVCIMLNYHAVRAKWETQTQRRDCQSRQHLVPRPPVTVNKEK